MWHVSKVFTLSNIFNLQLRQREIKGRQMEGWINKSRAHTQIAEGSSWYFKSLSSFSPKMFYQRLKEMTWGVENGQRRPPRVHHERWRRSGGTSRSCGLRVCFKFWTSSVDFPPSFHILFLSFHFIIPFLYSLTAGTRLLIGSGFLTITAGVFNDAGSLVQETDLCLTSVFPAQIYCEVSVLFHLKSVHNTSWPSPTRSANQSKIRRVGCGFFF